MFLKMLYLLSSNIHITPRSDALIRYWEQSNVFFHHSGCKDSYDQTAAAAPKVANPCTLQGTRPSYPERFQGRNLWNKAIGSWLQRKTRRCGMVHLPFFLSIFEPVLLAQPEKYWVIGMGK